MGEGHGTSTPSVLIILPTPPRVHQPRSFLNPILLTLLWRLHWLGMTDKSLTIGDWFSLYNIPLSLSRDPGWE